MSVLIKDMEMPKSCTECGQFRWSNILQSDVCRIAEAIGDSGRFHSENEGIENRPSWCPLVSVMPQSEQTLYGYPIEHLVIIARVMEKENCTPEIVAQMLQNAGEIAKMVRNEMMEMLKESVERSARGEENE